MVMSSLQTLVPCPGCLSTLTWILLCGIIIHYQVTGQCTVPGDLQDKWHRASDGKVITLTSTGLQNHQLKVGSTTYERFLCARSQNEDIFIFRLEQKVDGVAGKVMGYFCWKLTRVTNTTLLLYQLTPVARGGSFHDDRAVPGDTEGDSVPSVNVVCSLDAGALRPTLLYRLTSDAQADVNVTSINVAEQQCPSEVFATYTYTKDGSGCVGKDSQLDFCVDKRTAWVNYTVCDTKILFSEAGVLSCVASFKLASAVYVLLVNHDDSVDNANYFRFSCLKVEKVGGSERAVVYPRDCTATGGAHTLTLSRTVQGTEEFQHVVYLAVGVVVVLGSIVAIVIIVVCIKKRSRKTKEISPAPQTTQEVADPVSPHPKPNSNSISNSISNSNSSSNSNNITVKMPGDSTADNVTPFRDSNAVVTQKCPIGGRLAPLSQNAGVLAPLRA